MNKQQEKLYKEYVEDSEKNNETPMSKEDFVTELETQEKQEKEYYLNYQKKIGENNAKLTEGKEPEKILNKDEWIKAGKPTGESKHERFIRLVETRTDKVLSAMDKLYALKGANYESSLEERKQVIKALTVAIQKLDVYYEGKKEISTGFKIQPVMVESIVSA